MPAKGRKRLTEEDLEARVSAYCRRHGLRPTARGLPPFPAGQRETAQHREWLGIYKLHNRLGRRASGQCERCSSPASEGSVFCERHRAAGVAPAPARVGQQPSASLAEREALLDAQRSRCPVCDRAVGLWDSIDQRHADGQVRGLMHQACHQLVGLAEAHGPKLLDRLRTYLWPPGPSVGMAPRRRPRRS